MKVILIIIDGLGDEYIKDLDGTPLQYASKKFVALNKFAEEGLCGLMHPVAPGIPPSSDIGHLSIFGYDISKEYPGRGYFEAAGAGIFLGSNSIAFRANLATVRKEGKRLIIVDRRAGRISGDDASKLYKELDTRLKEQGLDAKVLHTLEHRGVLIIRGDDIIGAVTDTDPHEVGAPVLAARPWNNLDKSLIKHAEKAAEIINQITRLSYEALNDHEINNRRKKEGKPPANIILVRGGGIAKQIPSFKEKWGFRPAFIAAGALYKGIARALGMKEMSIEGATGTPSTNLENKVNACLEALELGYDFVFLHIKGTDNLSHDKKPKEKAEFILRIDRALEPIANLDDTLVVVTSDHSTSSIRGRHIGLPVPVVFWSKKIRRDSVKYFNEIECSKGGLGTIMGKDIMPTILDLTDRSVELGTRPTGPPLDLL